MNLEYFKITILAQALLNLKTKLLYMFRGSILPWDRDILKFVQLIIMR